MLSTERSYIRVMLNFIPLSASWMCIRMNSFLKIAAILAVAAGTSRASDYPCLLIGQTSMNCAGLGLSMPPPGNWEAITSLVLDDNPITELPKNSLSGFPALSRLSINNSPLAELDFGELVYAPELNQIVIQNNRIETLTPPSDGSTLPSLEYIYAYGNRIRKIDPDFFSFAPKLHELVINNNPIEVEAGQPLLNHPELQTLYVGIGSNSFKVVDSTLLSGLPNLTWLTLRSAQVSSIEGAFVNNELLETIYLNDNAITEVTAGTFASQGLITALELDGNPLTRLDTAAVNKAMAEGGVLSIKNTPLACNCQFEALFWWAAYKDITVDAACDGQADCSFTRRRLASPASPPQAPQSPAAVDPLGNYVGAN